MTAPNPPIGLDDPRVQARVDEKARAHQAEIEQRARAAVATPKTVGAWTFHPPNACTLDAVCSPAILQMSQMRMRIILGYLLTLEPADQIDASADINALRRAAALWEDSIPAEHLPAIIQIINAAFDWVQSRLTRDSVFFSAT